MKISLHNTSLDRSGKTPLTAQLQQLIDEIDRAGGGTLVVSAGDWMTGTLILPSNFTLHLEAGARLLASPNAEDYPAELTQTVAELSRMALIYARNAHHITLSGEGCLAGGASAWFAERADEQGYRQPKTMRPRMLVLEGCQQVRIRDITISDSPMWTAHLVSCNQVFIWRCPTPMRWISTAASMCTLAIATSVLPMMASVSKRPANRRNSNRRPATWWSAIA